VDTVDNHATTPPVGDAEKKPPSMRLTVDYGFYSTVDGIRIIFPLD